MLNKIILIAVAFLFLTTNLSFSKNYKMGNINMNKKTVAIDLDGVLDNYTKYTDEIPSVRKGAREFIVKLSKDYDLILFTTRSSKLATEWLINNEIDKYFKDVTNVKIPAHIYIDDRAINFNGDYDKTLEKIKNFNVYWKD